MAMSLYELHFRGLKTYLRFYANRFLYDHVQVTSSFKCLWI